MIKLSDLGQVYIVCGKTDLRKGIDGLATLVKEQFELDPFGGKVFLFCGGSRDRFKALYWDGQGFWLLDRKSTRLNSSHVSISYAVFCLKKKKLNILFL